MEKLRYSRNGGRQGGRAFHNGGRTTRGRGFFGNGRARGMAWVRPRGNDNTAESTGIPGVDDASRTDSQPAERSGDSSLSTNVESSGPILRGPRDHGFRGGFPNRSMRGRGRGRSSGRMAHQSSVSKHSWRRDTTSDIVKAETPKPSLDQSGPVVQTTNKQSPIPQSENEQEETQQAVVAISENPNESNGGFVRLGSHKLVLSKKTTPSGEPQESSVTVDVTDLPEPSRILSTEDAKSTKKHMLPTTDSYDKTKTTISDSTSEERKMVQQGSNKLVLSCAKATQAFSNDRPSNKDKNNNNNRHSNSWSNSSMKAAFGVRGAKRPRSPVNGPTVKRVKLAGSDASGKDDNGDPNPNRPTSSAPRTGKSSSSLTNFAYRETSNRFHGGRHVSVSRGRGGRGRHQRGQNMGLVRVDQDASKTPICPTFLRGIPCENEHCTKRHDVPRESAMPICSFFQRHGQCLKGSECPFRHVKVNSLATICPSFNLLGYCDDEKCAMKHVAATKVSMNSKRTTTAKNTKHDSSRNP